MRIGILSMQRVVNYGSFLQAYALKNILKEMGHDCEFIDIRQGRQINPLLHEGKIKYFIKRMKISSVNKIPMYIFVKKRERFFKEILFPMLGCTHEPNYSENYDAVVVGSDEVFNGTQKSKWGFTEQLYGNINCPTVISYAGSFGNTTMEKIKKYNLEYTISRSMKKMKTISVRDENSLVIVKELCGIMPQQHLDPTLVYDYSSLVPKVVKHKNYILVYAYDNRIFEELIINEVKSLAKKENKRIISVGFYQSWCDENILCSPFELLSYFKNADYVVTDTFHGTAFSIKMNRPFVSIIRDDKNINDKSYSNHEKLFDLLSRFNLKDHALSNASSVRQILHSPIDYKLINQYLKREAKRTRVYLENNLS